MDVLKKTIVTEVAVTTSYILYVFILQTIHAVSELGLQTIHTIKIQ